MNWVNGGINDRYISQIVEIEFQFGTDIVDNVFLAINFPNQTDWNTKYP